MQAYADAKSWQDRVTQLTTRHKSVDKEEHERVLKLLQDAQEQQASAKTAAEQNAQSLSDRIAELEVKLQQVLTIDSRAELPMQGHAGLAIACLDLSLLVAIHTHVFVELGLVVYDLYAGHKCSPRWWCHRARRH